jgi:hypothetical protein
MAENDGFDAWRKFEFTELSKIMQKRLGKMQNPDDCQNTKKIYCLHNGWGCGVGKS